MVKGEREWRVTALKAIALTPESKVKAATFFLSWKSHTFTFFSVREHVNRYMFEELQHKSLKPPLPLPTPLPPS